MENNELHFFIISDSVGETGRKVVEAVLAQFPDTPTQLHHYPFIRKEEDLLPILDEAKRMNGIIVHTLVVDDLHNYADNFCEREGLQCFDILKDLVGGIIARTGRQPERRPGALHTLDDDYFNRISAIEFAVKYDDGKDPKGLLEADLVLLGVSRTSKTPLSMFLANQKIKVANLPIMPEAAIPEELWSVNPKKIVGLTNDMDTLINFRKERLRAYGLPVEAAYADIERVKRELKFAHDLYTHLGCFIINVAHRSIEETAAIIREKVLNL